MDKLTISLSCTKCAYLLFNSGLYLALLVGAVTKFTVMVSRHFSATKMMAGLSQIEKHRLGRLTLTDKTNY